MLKIKITSNPYKREISFYKNFDEEGWSPVTLETDPNGKLLREDIVRGFFPFIVRQVTEILVEEYYNTKEPLKVVFEGTSEEYRELEAVISEKEFADKIILEKSGVFLENARDILPDIREIYKNVEPLIRSSVQNEKEQLEKEIQKFLDASSDQIPICILGNYSTGKSTFINALIGAELLPSGDEPVTAKIYKISNSKQSDRATVEYIENGKNTHIRFEDKGFRFLSGEMSSDLNKEIFEWLSENEEKDIVYRVSKVLYILGEHIKDDDNGTIEDLIEITVPFKGGLWNRSPNNFVIFDTPGSNSASNADHFRVLKKAMADMSNGMPVFVSEYNSLDSTDNEKLYKDIKSMEELDSRFTMIIVNKADTADLEEDEGKVGLPVSREKRMMKLAIPKNLYGDGIFFVSSIMGLGGKTQGKFNDKHYLRVFAQNKPFFSDPESELYQRLYRFNIMPEQLKRKAIERAEAAKDLIYINSGVFSVEDEIQNFGEKYSSYNKCFQSEMFLGKVLDLTSKEIQIAKETRERTKEARIKALERDKQELVERIQNQNVLSANEFISAYPEKMAGTVENVINISQQITLQDEKEAYTKMQEEELNLSKYKEKLSNSSQAIFANLRDGFKKAWSEKQFNELVNISNTFVEDVMKSSENNEELAMIEKQAKINADDMIIDHVNQDYKDYTITALDIFDTVSKEYWDQRADEIKTILSTIVTGSDVLTPERKEQLSKIIIDYQRIDFNKVQGEIVNKKMFAKGLFLGGFVIVSSDELNLNKLKNFYNTEIKKSIERSYENVQNSHRSSFNNWLENLENIIIDNLVEFNPELHSQNELIKEETRKIHELENNQRTLNDCREEIKNKMVWKSIS